MPRSEVEALCDVLRGCIVYAYPQGFEDLLTRLEALKALALSVAPVSAHMECG